MYINLHPILFFRILLLLNKSMVNITCNISEYNIWELYVFVKANVREQKKKRQKNKLYIYASSNKIATKLNRPIYCSFDRKRRDCRIAYVFLRIYGWYKGGMECWRLREREVAGCIQKCIWLPGKRSMEQHRRSSRPWDNTLANS